MTPADAPQASREARVSALKAAIDGLPAARGVNRNDSMRITTDFLLSAGGIVVEAARNRHVSVPAYLRRAAYAMACHDLGIPLSDAIEKDPRMARETGFAIADPEGVKFGPWEIESLVGDGDDDDPDA